MAVGAPGCVCGNLLRLNLAGIAKCAGEVISGGRVAPHGHPCPVSLNPPSMADFH